jgi:hypothetical protein
MKGRDGASPASTGSFVGRVLFQAARHLYGAQHGFGFVLGFFELALGIGIGDDSRTGLQICFAAFHEQGADRDA